MAHQAGETHGPAVHQRHAPAAAVDAEHGVPCGDAQVAPERQLEAAGDGVALHRGDHRLREQHARGAHRPVAVGCRAVAAAARHRLEVGARTEVARSPGEDRGREVVVRVEAAEGRRELLGGGPIDGVANLRTVDGDDGHGAVALGAYVAHVVSSRRGR